ncbi:protein spaetzle-like isoform X2 [Microplitis mediator]|uniref:protein spaetzle-like isoform X2 n=1 Tax=Microplitis mediator TaxID=375433 RepID=UPI002555BD6D|nr:protein spaetzle-like isoform X2 [Microplitis mediator]
MLIFVSKMLRRMLLFILVLLQIIKVINGLPSKLRTTERNFSNEKNFKNHTEISKQKNYKTTDETEQISFLDDLYEIFSYDPKDFKNKTELLPPKCDGRKFCEQVPYYPNDIIKKELQLKSDLKLLETKDEPLTLKTRFNEIESDSLCNSVRKDVFPRVAVNKDGEWKYIINNDDFVQRVSVEICEDESTSCKFIDGFADGYESTCKQKYIYKKLAAISQDGIASPDWFEMPVSCCCHVQYFGGGY